MGRKMGLNDKTAAGDEPRRLYAYNGGFWTKPRLRRILQLAGWRLALGIPRSESDCVAIWGNSPTAWRGRHMAQRSGARLLTVEDAFLRSVLPGRAHGPLARRGPIGLLLDPHGVHFDPGRPSLIETHVLRDHEPELLARARQGIARLQSFHLSKYNAHDPQIVPPSDGYVLVVDQTRGDASLMGADRQRFLTMLATARAEHRGKAILLKTHPETAAGLRGGHLTRDDLKEGDLFCDWAISPWALVRHAAAVYSVSSLLGYEAMLAGHRPRLFGLPFYAGWGQSDDEMSLPEGRRGRASVEDLFCASHLTAPLWYDPCLDRLTDFETAVNQLEAETATYRQDRDGHLAYGIRIWKRRFIAAAFGDAKPVKFTRKPGPDVTLCWANRISEVPQATRVEDGFLRSRGLGAELTPPLSLVADDLGIYYDPTSESRLERLIDRVVPPGGENRARALIDAIAAARLTKYNLDGPGFTLPSDHPQPVILVPGQVEDDASIRLGAGAVDSNLKLLSRTRALNPEAFLIYKPHPDVEAGLRPGAVPEARLAELADHVAIRASAVSLLEQVDEVWTMTSTLGFEALMRGIPVTVFGAPFYAGWGLTQDLGPVPERRRARPGLEALVHACLIAYPRYRDPVTGLPCSPETIIHRLADSSLTSRGKGLRALSKLQGAMSGHSWIWRR